MNTGHGASVWLVSAAIFPSCITGLLVFFSRCTMSSALPWSAVMSQMPPSFSTSAMRRATWRGEGKRDKEKVQER